MNMWQEMRDGNTIMYLGTWDKYNEDSYGSLGHKPQGDFWREEHAKQTIKWKKGYLTVWGGSGDGTINYTQWSGNENIVCVTLPVVESMSLDDIHIIKLCNHFWSRSAVLNEAPI